MIYTIRFTVLIKSLVLITGSVQLVDSNWFAFVLKKKAAQNIECFILMSASLERGEFD